MLLVITRFIVSFIMFFLKAFAISIAFFLFLDLVLFVLTFYFGQGKPRTIGMDIDFSTLESSKDYVYFLLYRACLFMFVPLLRLSENSESEESEKRKWIMLVISWLVFSLLVANICFDTSDFWVKLFGSYGSLLQLCLLLLTIGLIPVVFFPSRKMTQEEWDEMQKRYENDLEDQRRENEERREYNEKVRQSCEEEARREEKRRHDDWMNTHGFGP